MYADFRVDCFFTFWHEVSAKIKY